jgi:hypothetical protein
LLALLLHEQQLWLSLESLLLLPEMLLHDQLPRLTHALLLRALLLLQDQLPRLLSGSMFPAGAATDLDHCYSATSARVAKTISALLFCY